MALPHELPIVKQDISDPEYLRFTWSNYLEREAAYARKHGKRVIAISVDGADELAKLLTGPRRAR